MRRVEHMSVEAAMAAVRRPSCSTIALPSTTSTPILPAATLRASVVVVSVALISSLLLLMCPAVSGVADGAGRVRLDTQRMLGG